MEKEIKFGNGIEVANGHHENKEIILDYLGGLSVIMSPYRSEGDSSICIRDVT